MTAFIILCAVMVTAALFWLLLPLFRKTPEDGASQNRVERRASAAAIAVLVPALAIGMYTGLSNWDFDAVATAAESTAEMDDLLVKLEERLRANPTDVEGWMLLGRSYLAMGQFDRAVTALEHAHAAANGENVEAMVNLAEALTLVNQDALGGRAGELLESALAKAPQHPKALWYGALAALKANNLQTGRDRFRMLLTQNPPEDVRSIIERQLQDLDQQLGATGEGGAAPASSAPAAAATASSVMAAQAAPSPAAATPASKPQATSGRTLKVHVSIAPELQKKLSGPAPLFILARLPEGGPPLAAQRHSTAAAPFTVELSERDAMMASHTLATAPRVQVVARVSKSGMPQEQSGDYFGQAEYDFGAAGEGAVKIVIDRVVP